MDVYGGGQIAPPPEKTLFLPRYRVKKTYGEYITQFKILPKFFGENIEAIKGYQVIKIFKKSYHRKLDSMMKIIERKNIKHL